MEEEEEYIPEKRLKNNVTCIKIKEMAKLIEYTKKRICKIYCNDGGKGTGFFCIIPLDDWDNNLRVLITNNHVIGENDMINGQKINFTLDDDREEKEIIMDEERRKYTNEKFDITIIEIKKNDGIKNESFFEIDNKIFEDYKIYIKQTIYLLHYPKGKEMTFSEGIIKKIYDNKYTIEHLCDSDSGSSGGPLLNSIDYKVIGIHKGGAKGAREHNLGTLIKEPIEDFKKKLNNNKEKEEIKEYKEEKIKNNEIEKNKKKVYENGEYYIGDFLNGLKHGKGKLYYKDNTIKYEGDFANDKYEGKGKYIYKSGNFYIGDFLNGLRHGKGIEYYKNNTIKYEGNLVNDEYEGKGKYIWEDGEYYIGDFLKGLKHGKGKQCYKNNTIKYEGNFVNGKYI